MPQSEYKARAVRKKTREVVDYHRDTELPGKPLHLVIPGGLLALASLIAIGAVIQQTWMNHNWSEDSAILALVMLVPVYVGSVYLFSYGYELYDTERALKLTGWIVLLTLGIVVIVAVLFCLIAGASSSDSDSKESSKSSGSSSKGSSLGNLFSSTSDAVSSFAPVSIDLNFPSFIQTAAPAAIPEPARPLPVVCEFCKAEFIPEENEFTCPKCGAPSSRREPADAE